MVRLAHVATRAAGPEAYLVSLADILLQDTAAGPRLHVASARGGGILTLDPLNGLALLGQVPFPSGGGLDAPRLLVPATVAGQPGLLAFGRYGTAVEAFTLDAAGRPVSAPTLALTGEGVVAGAVSAATVAVTAGVAFHVTATRGVEGLSVWAPGGAGRMNKVAQTADAEILAIADIRALATIASGGQTGSQTRVLALAADGLYDLRLGTGGQLVQAGWLDQSEGLIAANPTALEIVTLAGRSYALVGAAGSGTLSVIEVLADGGLVLRDQVLDELGTRFGGLSALATATLGGQVYIAAGGADDGVTLLTLLPGGRLVHLSTLAHGTGMALANPAGLALVARGGGLDLFVAGHAGDAGGGGVTQLRADLGPVGVTQLLADGGQSFTGGAGRDQIVGGAGADAIRGGAEDDILVDGAGRDTLWGGTGADVFVLRPDGTADWIMDFEPGIDRLDLSELGQFYTLEALGFVETATGAELRIGAEWVVITRADGRPLRAADLNIEALRDLTHLPVAPPQPPSGDPPPGKRLVGTAGADTLAGGTEPDTLEGGGGADLLLGRAGADLLLGGTVRPAWDAIASQVFRLYQAVLDRAPDIGGLLNWHDRLEGGTLGLTQIAAGLVGSAEFTRAHGTLTDAAFVALLYANVLGRAPDPGGLAHWTGLLAGGVSRAQVVTGLSESPESRRLTAPDALAWSGEGLRMAFCDDVYRLYRGVLGRDPDPAGFVHWTGYLAEGTRTLASVVGSFVGSTEFLRVYGATTDAAFVTLLYANVLGRAPDPGGLAHWTGLLAGGVSRADVALGFTQSGEFIRSTAQPLRGWMRAQGGEDVLEGGAGDDVLFGGMFTDRFVLRADAPGQDRVIGFETWDKVQLSGFGLADAAAARAHMHQQGTAVVFEAGAVRVTFENTLMAAFADDVFLF